ncbi:hypothetical protein SAMN05421874_11615 [Nonomuraea maritima]|uniref:Uncharacterized protein n=1 Tax=Nonomuraea maritima TaxID=683260 RepID=A0A1G9HFN1_9ACTN|nr:hypothetical protein [Nonomuraea maritima]SDL11679.1 hypothetical protein SAMN05421874_11615 [Nonomuraea maritima]
MTGAGDGDWQAPGDESLFADNRDRGTRPASPPDSGGWGAAQPTSGAWESAHPASGEDARPASGGWDVAESRGGRRRARTADMPPEGAGRQSAGPDSGAWRQDRADGGRRRQDRAAGSRRGDDRPAEAYAEGQEAHPGSWGPADNGGPDNWAQADNSGTARSERTSRRGRRGRGEGATRAAHTDGFEDVGTARAARTDGFEVAGRARAAGTDGFEAVGQARRARTDGFEAAGHARAAGTDGFEAVVAGEGGDGFDAYPRVGGPARAEAASREMAAQAAGGGSRKRRRPPPSDWQFPLLTGMGLRPEQQRVIVIVAMVVVVLAGGVGLVAAINSIGSYTPAERSGATVLTPNEALPQVFHGWDSPELFAPLSERAKDGKPLTDKEVFGQTELPVAKKLKLKLVAKKLDAECAAALLGESLIEQVDDAGCTQAARGLYVSSDRRYVGQYTLLNLKDSESAAELVDALEIQYRGGWTRPLKSTKAVFPAGGYSEAGGYALGHYVGLVWLGRADGTEPDAKDDFVSLTLALRGAEKAIYRRVVSITGPSS